MIEDTTSLTSQLLLGTAFITANAVFHILCLVWLASVLKRVGESPRIKPNRTGLALRLGIAVFGLIAIHTVSTWGWALVYLRVGEFTDLTQALYFSVVTSTTLGYGDITLSEDWQLLSSFESMGGLILFGASTAFLIAVTRQWVIKVMGTA